MVPRFITYIPDRGTGLWRCHKDLGSLRNSLRQNGWGSRIPTWWGPVEIKRNAEWEKTWRVYEIGNTGTWAELNILDVFEEEFT